MEGRKIDRYLLEYEIKTKGIAIDDFCRMIGISRSTWQSWCNNQKLWSWYAISLAVDALGLSDEQIIKIFFAPAVSSTERDE